jgi:hypothetical protein
MITGSTDLGNGKLCLTIDHDPTVYATDAPAGSLFIDADGIIWRKKDDGSTTNVERFYTASTFSIGISTAIDDTLSTTTQRSYQTKLSHAYQIPVTGLYFIFFTAEIANSAANKDTYIKFDINNVNIVNEAWYYYARANAYNPFSGFTFSTLTGGVTYTFKIKYYAGSNTAQIRRTRIFIMRLT